LGVSLLLLYTGLIKRSYDFVELKNSSENLQQQEPGEINDRLEMLKEVIFLLPIIVCALLTSKLMNAYPGVHRWWAVFTQRPVIAGLLGSLAGYFFGCGIVWMTRIFGTLGFGREAMGLGDVHLMGAAGAIIGPLFVIIAFFVAPFFGLIWAGLQMFFKKTRQIPYGPFLSLGILTVMIFHDRILGYLKIVFEW
jgi:prepilin signal peptidase PulO-like enzyme (type II secretory pathway)